MTVREFAKHALKPVTIKVVFGMEEYDLINHYNDELNYRLLNLLGDFSVEHFFTDGDNKYTIWPRMVPITEYEYLNKIPSCLLTHEVI